MFRYVIILAFVLAAYWLSLSGYFKPMLLTLGVISILIVLGLCARMKIFDRETVPYLDSFSVFRYLIWLSREIVKANMQVVRAVLNPDMEISPALVKIPLTQKTGIGQTMFANSITLTPGTVSLAIDDKDILVHALLEDMAVAEDFAEMGYRSAQAVGEKGTL